MRILVTNIVKIIRLQRNVKLLRKSLLADLPVK